MQTEISTMFMKKSNFLNIEIGLNWCWFINYEVHIHFETAYDINIYNGYKNVPDPLGARELQT
jgi:hypothetical protein